jgi:hypothetical protein
MLTGPSSVLSLLGEMYMLYILSVLSRKLGAVTKMKPYYRGYYVAMGLIGVAVVAHSLWLTAQAVPNFLPWIMTSEAFSLGGYYAPMAVAATIGLILAMRYWGWLFRERVQ